MIYTYLYIFIVFNFYFAVYKIFQDLDAIIGDITIVAHRLKCVDFTLPYLDSSVAMVVRVKDVSTSTGILFKPFEWTLWLILGVIFVAATIIIIILEKYKSTTNKVDEFLVNPFLVYKMGEYILHSICT